MSLTIIIPLLKGVVALLLMLQSTPGIDDATRQQVIQFSQEVVAQATKYLTGQISDSAAFTTGVGGAGSPVNINESINSVAMYTIKVNSFQKPSTEKPGVLEFQVLAEGKTIKNNVRAGLPLLLPSLITIFNNGEVVRQYTNDPLGLNGLNEGQDADGKFNDFYTIPLPILESNVLEAYTLIVVFQGEEIPEVKL